MSKWLTVVLCAGFVSACSLAGPSTPDYQFTMSGNYKAIAECAYLNERRHEPGVSLVDLSSANSAELVFQGPTGPIMGRLVFTAEGSGTRVTSYFPRAIYGADFYQKRHRPRIESCG
jgi:hypothetical protein